MGDILLCQSIFVWMEDETSARTNMLWLEENASLVLVLELRGQDQS